MNYIFKASIASLATVIMLGMSGCSDSGTTSTGDGTVDSGTVDDGTVSYAGALNLSGIVDTSSLSAQDQAETRARSRSTRAEEITEIVKLYVVGADGEYVDTNITCDIDTGAYVCPNIAGNQEYIIRYVKDLGQGRVLELKTSATVADVSPDAVVVSPITTMIVEAIVTAVQNAIAGITSDDSLIADIIESVKAAIVETMTTLINTGVIQVPSLVADGNFTAIQVEATVTESANSGLADAAAIVTTNDAVVQTIDVVQNQAAGEAFLVLSDAEKMDAVFETIGWNEDMPGWVLTMFAAEYNNMDANWTFGWLFDNSTLTLKDANDIDLERFGDLGFSDDVIIGYATTIATDINAKLTDGTIFNDLKDQIVNYHAIKVKIDVGTALTEAETEFLANFPAVVGEVFPSDFASTMTMTTPMQNMGQMFLILGYIDIYDGEIGDMIRGDLKAALGDAIMYEAQIEYLGEALYLDDAEQLILEMYTETELATYDAITVSWINGRSETLWNDDTQTETTVLALDTGLSSISWDVGGGMSDEDIAGITAVLTYPTATGFSDVNLSHNTDGDHSYYGLSPWIENTDRVNDWDPYWIPNPDATQLVSDFVTGAYTVTFTFNGETYARSTELYFIPNANSYMAKLTSPEGMPQWDNDWNSLDWSVVLELPEYKAFEEANNAYWQNGVQSFAPNVDTTGDDVNDTLSGMIVRWEAPDLTGLVLPENIQVAYNVSVRLSTGNWEECGDDWEACNIDIYNTWNDDRLITTTSLTLPVDLKINDVNSESNYDLSVDVMFINRDTGKEVARGGWSNAQFKVGQPTELTGTEVITFAGTVTVEEYEDSGYTPTMPTNMMIALYSEEWGESDNGEWFNNRTRIAEGTYNSADGTFSISLTAAVLEANIGMNKNIQLIGFDDVSGDGEWQDWDSTDADGNYNGEPSFWLNSWMWIDTWGDTTIYVGDNETGEDTSYRLVKDTNTTIDNLSIIIW